MKRTTKTTTDLTNISSITNYSLRATLPPIGNEIVSFIIKPDNLSVLSESALFGRIFALTAVIKSIAELEMLCLDSRESFDENKLFLKKRIEAEANSAVRKLLEQDIAHLDEIQSQTATAREFLIAVRLKDEKEKEKRQQIGRIEKLLSEAGFSARAADGEDIKRVLAVYFEQNVTTECFESFDGERWIL